MTPMVTFSRRGWVRVTGVRAGELRAATRSLVLPVGVSAQGYANALARALRARGVPVLTVLAAG